MTAVEAFGDAQERRQPAHRAALLLQQPAEVLVALLGSPRAVIARHVGHHRQMLGREPAQIAIQDHVARMLGVAVVPDGLTHVVE